MTCDKERVTIRRDSRDSMPTVAPVDLEQVENALARADAEGVQVLQRTNGTVGQRVETRRRRRHGRLNAAAVSGTAQAGV